MSNLQSFTMYNNEAGTGFLARVENSHGNVTLTCVFRKMTTRNFIVRKEMG